MAELEEQIQSISNTRASRSFDKDSLAQEVRRIHSAAADFSSAVAQLLDSLVNRLNPLVVKADFRKGVSTESKTKFSAELSDSQANDYITQLIDPQLIDCQCDAQPAPRIVEFDSPGEPRIVITVPLFQGDMSHADGAISILIKPGPESPETVAAEIESLSIGIASISAGTDSKAQNDQLQIIGKVGGINSTKELGFLLVNQLANKYEFEQVFFGTVTKKKVNVEAISGVSNFKSNSPGVANICQAMEECLDCGSEIIFQSRGEAELESGFQIHKQWSTDSNDSAVCTIPLFSGDRIVACISFQRPGVSPISATELDEIKNKINPFGPAIQLINRANTPAGHLIRQSVSRSLKNAVTPKSWLGRFCLLIFTLALAYFLFATTVFRPSCLATLAPQQVTNFSAPFDTVLKAVHVSAGDEVKQGQLLYEMDSTILESQKDAIQSQLAATKIELKLAMSQDDVSAAALHKKLQLALNAQLRTIDEKLRLAQVVAPCDGIITKCELSTRVGQSFRIGDPMLVFAKKDDWRVEVQVPDHLASHIRQEQVGTFASLTRPGRKFNFKVDEFDRSSQLKNGNNIFVARGKLDSAEQWMRSGMEGYVRIETVQKPVWWVTFHRLIDSARINFWF